MVDSLVRLAGLAQVSAAHLLAADDKSKALLWRLSSNQRAIVLAALVGVVLAGLGLVALVLVGGWRLRRIARQRPGPTPKHDDDWYRKPLVPRDSETRAADDPPTHEAP